MTTEHPHDGLDVEQVVSTLRDAKVVMLTSVGEDDRLEAHPMTPQRVDDDATVWFLVGKRGDQADNLAGDHRANVAVASPGSWLSVSGTVEFVDDPALLDQFHDETAEKFADKEDSAVLRFTGQSAQSWGQPGGPVRALAAMVGAKVTGKRPEGGSGTTEL